MGGVDGLASDAMDLDGMRLAGGHLSAGLLAMLASPTLEVIEPPSGVGQGAKGGGGLHAVTWPVSRNRAKQSPLWGSSLARIAASVSRIHCQSNWSSIASESLCRASVAFRCCSSDIFVSGRLRLNRFAMRISREMRQAKGSTEPRQPLLFGSRSFKSRLRDSETSDRPRPFSGRCKLWHLDIAGDSASNVPLMGDNYRFTLIGCPVWLHFRSPVGCRGRLYPRCEDSID